MLTFQKVASLVFRFSITTIKFPKITKLSKGNIRTEFGFIVSRRAYSTSRAVFCHRSIAKDPPVRNIRYPKLFHGHLTTMKLESEHYKALFTPELVTLSKLFSQNGYELRMAGGAVRDLLMDKKPVDIDFATTATPTEMKEMFEREGIRMINLKGEKHGTITARINEKENFEITTLRIDVSTDGRHAEVEFTKNWELDAGRRDLTINSMFLDLDGTVYDYFNGMEDLKNLAVRFVGDPKDRIQEDYLRILRYFRFYGRIIPKTVSGTHDVSTLQAIRENVSGLKQISGERIWSELRKILTGNHALELVLTMLEVGIGDYIDFPKEPNIEEYKMRMERLKSLNLETNAITSLCALLKAEEDALRLHARLKLSSFERDLCIFLVRRRDKEEGDDTLAYYQEILLMTNEFMPHVVRSFVEELLKYKGDVDMLRQVQEWEAPRFPVNGHALIERQIRGRAIGPVMTEMKLRWIASNFTLTKDELITMLPELKERCLTKK